MSSNLVVNRSVGHISQHRYSQKLQIIIFDLKNQKKIKLKVFWEKSILLISIYADFRLVW